MLGKEELINKIQNYISFLIRKYGNSENLNYNNEI